MRAGTDPLPADNTFHFTSRPSAPVSVLVVDSGDTRRCELLSDQGARHRHHAGVPDRRRAGRARDAGEPREARGRDPERRRRFRPPAGRRRAEAVRRARRRPARRRRRAHARGRRAKPTCCRARSAPTVDRTAAAAPRSASSTTAIPSSRSSRRRAAATSPPRASPLPRARPRRPATACSRGSTMARWRRSERKVGHRPRHRAGRPRSTTRGATCRCKPVYLPLVHQLVKLPRRSSSRRGLVDRRTGRRCLPALTQIARRTGSSSRRPAKRVTRRVRPARAGRAGRLRSPAGWRHADGAPQADRRQHRSGRVRPDAARPGRTRRRGHRARHASRLRHRQTDRSHRSSTSKTQRSGRASGGICWSPACCCWRPKRWSRIACRRGEAIPVSFA